MSDDLDTALRGLRDELHTDIPVPDLARIAGRARQRRTVRRMQIGAVAAVVLVSVAVPMLRSMPTDGVPPAQPPAIRSVPYTVDFADAEHGYALSRECTPDSRATAPDGQYLTRCSFALLATDDGGRNWRPRELPGDTEPSYDGFLQVHGPERILFGRVVYHDVERSMSDDAGRTWRRIVPDDVDTTGEPSPFPPGSQLATTCLDAMTDKGCTTGLGALSPDADRVNPALTQPPLSNPHGSKVATAGDRYWTVGRDPATRRFCVSVTSDAGASWSTTMLDIPGAPVNENAWAVVENDGVMYLTVEGTLARGGTPGLLAVFRSTDGGVSWTRTWHAEQNDPIWGTQGSTVAAADGRLIVNSLVDGTFESTDGGQTFTVAKRQLPPWRIEWTRGGYLARGPNNRFQLSQDGLDWRPFQLP
jgi:photosystem II stability/assembly factor-like uncharacterized protein